MDMERERVGDKGDGIGEREGEGELNGYFVKCPSPLFPESPGI